MNNSKYTAEFRAEALKQITERGHSVQDVAKRLGVSEKPLPLVETTAGAKPSSPSYR